MAEETARSMLVSVARLVLALRKQCGLEPGEGKKWEDAIGECTERVAALQAESKDVERTVAALEAGAVHKPTTEAGWRIVNLVKPPWLSAAGSISVDGGAALVDLPKWPFATDALKPTEDA